MGTTRSETGADRGAMDKAGDEAVAEAKQTIEKGSKSFAAAARLFEPAMRADAVLLYAWCRHCDDVIDGQDLGYAAATGPTETATARLDRLRCRTRAALDGTADDAVFAGFAGVMRRHAIPVRHALDHLDGFAMDVAGRQYETLEETLAYCHGVAGVVGIMMAYIMSIRDAPTLQRAADLGLAFQLTNIARDIVDDAAVGRIYLPSTWLNEAGIPRDALHLPQHRGALAGVARRLIDTAEPYYASAMIGIGRLPPRAAWAIATAHGVYRAIGATVVARGPQAWDRRASTSTMQKLGYVVKGGGQALAARLLPAKERDRGPLWSKVELEPPTARVDDAETSSTASASSTASVGR